jgi:mRNA-degrading endonuclease toxin of MazEF toxin-antitoxin module
LANLNPTRGSEQPGIRFELIFQTDLLNRFTTTVLTIPLTTLSTEQESYSLRNVVTLECAELDPVRTSAVTTVSDVQGTQTSLTKHGSGMYSSEQNSNVHTENRSIYFGKSTEAEYKPPFFDFGDLRKRIDEATYLEDETISEVDKTSSAMRFDSSFNGSLYISARTNDSAISEMYIGEFNVSEYIAISKHLKPTPTPTPTWLPCPFPTNESECMCEP